MLLSNKKLLATVDHFCNDVHISFYHILERKNSDHKLMTVCLPLEKFISRKVRFNYSAHL